MKRLHFWLAGLCLWFFFFYNIERLSEPINIASFVYVFVPACAVAIILIRPLQRQPWHHSFFLALLPFFILKVYFDSPIGGTRLPITVTEMGAIGLTIFLSGRIACHVEALREAVVELTLGHMRQEVQPFSTAQGRIYSEIHRARLYKRPLALMAVSATDHSLHHSMDRFLQEAQREIIKQYVTARIADLLVEELKDCDIVARRNNHFILLLPETDRENVTEVVARLEVAAAERLSLNFKIGLSTFPDEAVTFEGLIEQAELEMRRNSQVGDPPAVLTLHSPVA